MSLILAWIAFGVYAWFAAAYLYALLINLRLTYLGIFLGFVVIAVAALVSSYDNSALGTLFLFCALCILLGELRGYARLRASTHEYAHHRDIIFFRKPVKP
jgi:hypothetical protein